MNLQQAVVAKKQRDVLIAKKKQLYHILTQTEMVDGNWEELLMQCDFLDPVKRNQVIESYHQRREKIPRCWFDYMEVLEEMLQGFQVQVKIIKIPINLIMEINKMKKKEKLL